MDEKGNFADDLAALATNVNDDVGAILKAVQDTKTKERPSAAVRGVDRGKPSERPAPADGVEPAAAAKVESLAEGEAENRQRSQSRNKTKPIPEQPVVLKNVTTRLRPATDELLTEAALRQRLARETPATRQDIVEEALQEWFRKRRYALTNPPRGRD